MAIAEVLRKYLHYQIQIECYFAEINDIAEQIDYSKATSKSHLPKQHD
jgi:hypothetical protein